MTKSNNINKLPKKNDLVRLVSDLKKRIGDDYRADEESETPSMCLTVGWTHGEGWGWQTGDNSYTGGAYGHRHWAVVTLYPREGDSRGTADDIFEQLLDAHEGEKSASGVK